MGARKRKGHELNERNVGMTKLENHEFCTIGYFLSHDTTCETFFTQSIGSVVLRLLLLFSENKVREMVKRVVSLAFEHPSVHISCSEMKC